MVVSWRVFVQNSPMRLFFFMIITFTAACTIERQPAGAPFSDDFERSELGDNWNATGHGYRISDRELVVAGVHNHPLWLKSPLPRDAVVEVDCWSNDDAGDIKLEAWGDGKSYARSASYSATSYVFIFGGWHNTVSAIARMHEHGADRRTRTDVRVEKGRRYHFRIERRGGHIDWQIDRRPFLSFDDPRPLLGPDHAYFGFNDWEAELHFDNLKISSL
jgi:hypothetical protein